MSERIKWVDSLKGIGIILVILGHAPISQDLFGDIYIFHMPLFFFISGYLFNKIKYDKFKIFIKSKICSLLIPYVCFSGLAIILYLIRSYVGNTDSVNFIEIIKAFFISRRNGIFYDVPLWFFTCLFIVEILYYGLRKLIKNDILLIFTMIVLSYIGLILLHAQSPSHQMPWSMVKSFFVCKFISVRTDD